MKKNEYFVDVSVYQSSDLSLLLKKAGTKNTIIKVSESTNYINPKKDMQAATSNPIGYYHFARFGSSKTTANLEFNYFVNKIPSKKVKYLVVDYEQGATSNISANTSAVLEFMRLIKVHGYEPILYSGKSYIVEFLDYMKILKEFPNSFWVASYPDMEVRADPLWAYKPNLPGMRWWQYTSTALVGGLDKNVVLMDDVQKNNTKKKLESVKMENGFLVKTKGSKNKKDDGKLYFVNQSAGYAKHITDKVFVWVNETKLKNPLKTITLTKGELDSFLKQMKK